MFKSEDYFAFQNSPYFNKDALPQCDKTSSNREVFVAVDRSYKLMSYIMKNKHLGGLEGIEVEPPPLSVSARKRRNKDNAPETYKR